MPLMEYYQDGGKTALAYMYILNLRMVLLAQNDTNHRHVMKGFIIYIFWNPAPNTTYVAVWALNGA